MSPQQAFYWHTLAWAEYRAGNSKAAVTALEKVKELGSPGNSFEWFLLAMVQWELGDKEKAQQWYDKARKWMDKNDPENAELRRFREEAAQLLRIKEESTRAKDPKDV